MPERDETSRGESLVDVTARLRQALELQSIIRDERGLPGGAAVSAFEKNRAAASSSEPSPRPAATVSEAQGAPPPRAASVIEPWQRDPAELGSLGELQDTYGACQRCPLGETRTNFVFGVGNSNASVMFVGEAPGRDEDLQGEPFVGRAGQLLNKILEAIGFQREDVYIANILKCRPPGNRDPLPDEIASCEPILARQIEIIQPVILCTLGAFAARTLLGVKTAISKLRGNIHDYRGVPLIPTYHPAALLRNPAWKRPTWEDVQLLRREHDRLLAETKSG